MREHYQAKFVTMNPDINGTIPGAANLYRIGTRLIAHVRFFAGGPGSIHRQTVYDGNRCPTLEDDLNSDGFIDINEAELVLGQRLIPLDGNVNTQKAGTNLYPVSDEGGSYEYEEFASYAVFMKDLKAKDPDPNDDLRKLVRGEGLNITSRTVLIQGVSKNQPLPDTVIAGQGLTLNDSFPVACGVFVKYE